MTESEDLGPTTPENRAAIAYLGLGANLGDRAANLWEAVRRMATLAGCDVVRCSALYETEPVGPPDQNWFLNAAIAVRTTLTPFELLDAAKRIESELGRAPGPRWGPRPIDVDILLYEDATIESAELSIPHRELWNRRFVLAPLADVLPAGTLADRVTSRLAALGPTPVVRRYVSDSQAEDHL